MITPIWRRAVVAPVRVVHALALIAGTAAAVALAIPSPSPVWIAASTPTPEVTVATPVLVLPPAPPLQPRREPAPEPPPLRAATPTIDGACLLALEDAPASCRSDSGFPAISADGRTIAIEEYLADGDLVYPGLQIRFVDARTSRTVGTVVVLEPVDELEDGAGFYALEARVERSAASAQRRLDHGGYRSLVALDDAATIDAEQDGDRVRMIDPATSTVLWRHRFHEPRPESDDEMCPGWSLAEMRLWWDPPTRTVVADAGYPTGGCLRDPLERRVRVARVPLAAPPH